jgi:UDPglucose--hexose-1-phosphate uridylyltransferase
MLALFRCFTIMSFDPAEQSHRRYDPLGDEWVLVSPHRAKRPWQGQQDVPDAGTYVPHDSACYLCPGNARVTGEKNPRYESTYVFANDFSALQQGAATPEAGDALFKIQAAHGESRVICYAPDHSKTLPDLSLAQIEDVISCWRNEAASLGERYTWVQIFENKGTMMGCSNPHPHGQIWASAHMPQIGAVESRTQRDWFAKYQTPMLLELAQREAGGPRVVVEIDHWLAIVPYWAKWPYEILLLPRFACQQLTAIEASQQSALAQALKNLTTRYDNLFQTSFPYSMGWHGAPFDGAAHPEWQLHAHFYPPLLRSASVRKFMVGYEMLAETQRDLTPEQAAEQLRTTSDIHYRD